MNAEYMIGFLFGQVLAACIGAPIGALLGAVVLRIAFRIVVGNYPPYWTAYKAVLIAFMVTLAIGLAFGIILGGTGVRLDAAGSLVALAFGFLVQCLIYARYLKNAAGEAVAFGAYCLVGLTQVALVGGSILFALAAGLIVNGLYKSLTNPGTSATTASQVRWHTPYPATSVQRNSPEPIPVQQKLKVESFSSVKEAQSAAMARYPALAIAGSEFNRAFIARYRYYEKVKPDYLRTNSWPVMIAEEIYADMNPR